MLSVFYFLVLVFSVVIHEVSHGYAAKAQGDDTAEMMGRLTLNPLRHIDPVGSVLVPLFLYISSKLLGGPLFLFGWAKPVPVDPSRFKNRKWGEVLVSLAGPASNLGIALLIGMGIKLGLPVLHNDLGVFIVYENVLLAVFNLMPVPPLDGSNVLFGMLPYQWRSVESFLVQNSFLLFFVFLFLGMQFVMPLVAWLAQLLM